MSSAISHPWCHTPFYHNRLAVQGSGASPGERPARKPGPGSRSWRRPLRFVRDCSVAPHGRERIGAAGAACGDEAGEEGGAEDECAAELARWIAERMAQPLERGGSAVVSHRVADPGWIVRHVLQYAGDAVVEEPEEARGWMARAAAGCVRAPVSVNVSPADAVPGGPHARSARRSRDAARPSDPPVLSAHAVPAGSRRPLA